MSELGIINAVSNVVNKKTILDQATLKTITTNLRKQVDEIVKNTTIPKIDSLLTAIPPDTADPENITVKEFLQQLRDDAQKISAGITVAYDKTNRYNAVLTNVSSLIIKRLELGTRYTPAIPVWAEIEKAASGLVNKAFENIGGSK
jgi:hypothetical protein